MMVLTGKGVPLHALMVARGGGRNESSLSLQGKPFDYEPFLLPLRFQRFMLDDGMVRDSGNQSVKSNAHEPTSSPFLSARATGDIMLECGTPYDEVFG